MTRKTGLANLEERDSERTVWVKTFDGATASQVEEDPLVQPKVVTVGAEHMREFTCHSNQQRECFLTKLNS